MNEITTPNAVSTSTFMFQNEELNRYSEQIARFNGNISASEEIHTINVSNNLCQIALIMAEIDTKELYKQDGFKSAIQYAMDTFDYKRSMAGNLVRVGKQFGERLLTTNFNFTQLVEALPMGVEKFDELCESGEISDEMSMKEIREVAKENKVKPRKASKEKEFYYRVGEHTIGPQTESMFAQGCDEIHKFKSDSGATMYAIRIETVWAVWERIDVVETETK